MEDKEERKGRRGENDDGKERKGKMSGGRRRGSEDVEEEAKEKKC